MERLTPSLIPRSKPDQALVSSSLTENGLVFSMSSQEINSISKVEQQAEIDESCAHAVHIRPANREDLNAIDDFLVDFVAAGRILPRTIDELEQLIPTGFIAEIQEQIVGFVTLEIYSRKLAEVRSLCVRPIMQGQGIGKKLIQACVNLATERNVFEVMAITSTEEFFRNCGFDFTLPGEKKALFLQTRETP